MFLGKKEKHLFEYKKKKINTELGMMILYISKGVEIVTYDKRIDFYSSMDEIEEQLNKEIFWRNS